LLTVWWDVNRKTGRHEVSRKLIALIGGINMGLR
jgi:hypothetical protein